MSDDRREIELKQKSLKIPLNPSTNLTVANSVLASDLIKTFVMVIQPELNEFPPEIRREIRD